MSVFNKGMKDYDCLCFIILEISFVDICDFEDQITFHDQFEQKTRKLKIVHLLYVATILAKKSKKK